MQDLKSNHEQKLSTELEHPRQVVIEDKGSIIRSEIKEKPLKVSIRAPIRAHQQVIQRQQYYTGDA